MRRREFLGLVGAATVTWPLPVRAQSARKFPLVGYLWHTDSAENDQPYYGAVIDGFAKLGYIDGRTIRLEHRFPDETPKLFKSMAAELVSLNPDVLMCGSNSAYLKAATQTIPIVFMFVPDPVGVRFVENLARPGGNMTGLSNFGRDIAGKRLQILKEAVPGLSRVALLINSNQQSTAMYIDVMTGAAKELGLRIETFDARRVEELEPAFREIKKSGMEAITPAQGGTAFQWRRIIPKLAMDYNLPLCAYSRETFEYGALMSYGPDQIETCHRSAALVDKILKGAKPSEIPVEQPTKFEFLLNLKTAKTLGIAVPTSTLLRADEVIE